MPGAIVGAIANEGGLHRSDFGHITIRPDHSLVELPAKLSKQTLKALEHTRIQGQLINLEARPRSGKASPQTEMTVSKGTKVPAAQGGLESVGAPERVASLTGIRAVAALLVMATHAAYTTGKYTHGYVGLVYSRMEIGVPIFFVLSGFLLFGPWVQGRRRRVGLRRRCAATPGTGCAASCPPTSSPCWSPTSSTTSAPPGPNPGHTWMGLFRNLTLTQIYTDHYLYSYLHQALTQMWSLAVEVAFYVVLPLLAYLLLVVLCRRQWRPVLLLAGLAVPGRAHACVAGVWCTPPTCCPTARGCGCRPIWPWFLGGMLLAVLQAMGVRGLRDGVRAGGGGLLLHRVDADRG